MIRTATSSRANAVVQRYLAGLHKQQDLTALNRELRKRLRRPNGERIPLIALPVARALRGEHVANDILVLHQPDRTDWLSVSTAPIIDAEGHLLGAVLSFANITPMHEGQQRLEDYLRTISHDLRNPLSVISGHAGLLESALREQCPDEQMLFSVSAIGGAVSA